MATNTASSSDRTNAPVGQSAANPSQIDQVLQETEIGAWIAEHKGLALSLVILAILGVVGYGGYTYYQSQHQKEVSKAVYQFETSYITPLKNEEISAQEYVKNWENFYQKWGPSAGVVPPTIESVDNLIEGGHLNEAAGLLEKTAENSYGVFPEYLLNIRRAVVFEDLGKIDMAITALEEMNKSELDLLGSKVYFDLGRLYYQQGRMEKARLSFDHVVSHMAQDEFAKISRVYLSRIKEAQKGANE